MQSSLTIPEYNGKLLGIQRNMILQQIIKTIKTEKVDNLEITT